MPNNSRKAAKILASFIKPNQIFGQDMVIPPDVLANAKGLAIITVLKAGFLFSGRAGSGVIVARLPDGHWSAPSAIVTAGAGVGGQIGAELTDFVFILNNKAAVDSFSQAGSITLGGNVSLAAGPLGRNAEAAGSASLGSVAAIFSYSKTKGLFAGVSLEGSVLVERREANRKFYGNNCTARSILSGRVDPPPECDSLFRVLESRAFRGSRSDSYDDFYDDIPDEFSDSDSTLSGRGGSYSGRRGGSGRGSRYDDDDYDYEDDYEPSYRRSGNSRRSKWADDVYDAPETGYSRGTSGRRTGGRSRYDDDDDGVDDVTGRMQRSNLRSDNPGRPSAPKPRYRNGGYGDDYEDDVYRTSRNRRDDDIDYARERDRKLRQDSVSRNTNNRRELESSSGPKAVALFTFNGEQDGDLSFKKGDVISIIKKSDSTDDWWTGRAAGKEGIFPANYVELV